MFQDKNDKLDKFVREQEDRVKKAEQPKKSPVRKRNKSPKNMTANERLRTFERRKSSGKLTLAEMKQEERKEYIRKTRRQQQKELRKQNKDDIDKMYKEYKSKKLSKQDKAIDKGKVIDKTKEKVGKDGSIKRVKKRYNPFSYKSNMEMVNSLALNALNKSTGGLINQYNKKLSKRYGRKVEINKIKDLPIVPRLLLMIGVLTATFIVWLSAGIAVVFLLMAGSVALMGESTGSGQSVAKDKPPTENVEVGGGGPVKDTGHQYIPMQKQFLLPVKNAPYITSPWLRNRKLVTNQGYQNRPHAGTDLSCNSTHGIFAVGDGEVIQSTYHSGWGNYVQIQHGSEHANLRTLYAHMVSGSVKVKKGDRVVAGQRLGTCGKTGNVTGEHLHFEVWKPLPYKYSMSDPPLDSNPYLGAKPGQKGPIK